ncbi:MAG: molybdate ABC transporter substrate-binding protein [Ignavibacteriaceae bacterium]|nr:molybdate ABC transporter substrate-binding protein [Ignavibacteriaceae bacterium]
MKKLLLLIFVAALVKINAQSITIAAAADLRYALDDITKLYKENHQDVKIDAIYGSSGNLFQQISNQAPYDLFFSADLSFANKLDSLKLTSGKPTIYAVGHLVLWSSTKDVSKGLDILKSNDIKKISIANPVVAPYGKRAVETLNYYKLYDIIKDKIVKGDNVSQAAQFVLTGNAEVGIIALSLALSPEMSSKGKYFLIDEKSYSKLEQAYVVLKKSEKKKELLDFVKFLGTKKVKDIFSKYGFKLPVK